MRPVSTAFLRTLQGSHVMTARARVCTTFQTGTNPAGTVIPILGGDVTLDGNADVRSTLDLITDGAGMWPDSGTDLLTPYGNEVFVERGIVYGNGVTEWVSLGYFRIDTPEQDVVPDGPIRIAGQDRMSGIVDARLEAPIQFAATAQYGDVVEQLVWAVYPLATIEWPDGGDGNFLLRALIAEEDRYDFLNQLVTSAGKIWYWDHRGVLVIKNAPNPSSSVWTVAAGKGGVLIEMSRALTRKGVYNAVVATGEAGDTTPPARAVARDINTESPTYYYGPFGPVPRFYSSTFITTNAQAASAARALLLTSLGLPYSVDFQSVANPALEPFDPITLKYPERARSGTLLQEVHIIDTLKIGLTHADPTSGSTREQTVVLITTSEG